MHSFEVHSNESVCRKNVRLGMEQVYSYWCPVGYRGIPHLGSVAVHFDINSMVCV